MKHLLFLIVAAAIYFHFYPNEKVTKIYLETKQVALDSFSVFGETQIRLKADKVYQDLESDLERFSVEEIKHLKEITSSRENVKNFYYSICKTEKRDIFFHINHEKKVCSVIDNYANLL